MAARSDPEASDRAGRGTVMLTQKEETVLNKVETAPLPPSVRDLARRWILSGLSTTLFVMIVAVAILTILVATLSIRNQNSNAELRNNIVGLNQTKMQLQEQLKELRAKQGTDAGMSEAQIGRIEMAAMLLGSMNMVKEASVKPLPNAKAVFDVSLSATSARSFTYSARLPGGGNFTVERKGDASGVLFSTSANSGANPKLMELLMDEGYGYFVARMNESCPDACESCEFFEGRAEFQCVMPIPLQLSDNGKSKTCGGSHNNDGASCLAEYRYRGRKRRNCTLYRGVPRTEWCYTGAGFASWGYCRCASVEEMMAHVSITLPMHFCSKVTFGSPKNGTAVVSLLSVAYAVKNDVTNAKPNAVAIYSPDNEPLFFSSEPHTNEKKSFHGLTYWNGPCRSAVGEAESLEECSAPIAANSFEYGGSRNSWSIRIGQDMHPSDFLKMEPLVILGILGHLQGQHLKVKSVQEEGAAEKAFPHDHTARCGHRRNTTTRDKSAELNDDEEGNWDADDLLDALLVPARFPCRRTVTHSGCKCNGATALKDGAKLAWCYVNSCDDCGEEQSGCVNGFGVFKRPYAYCYGDGLYANRPANGLCPAEHECLGRPYSSEHNHLIDLKKTLGRPIKGRTSEFQSLSTSAWWNPKDGGTWSLPVDFLYCIPLGEYSRVLFSGLYISHNKTTDTRSEIPIDTKMLGHSVDLFLSMAAQDFHIKIDTMFYISLDASYLDCELWLDLVQPLAQRTEFPLLWTITQLQRNKKNCLDQELLDDLIDIDIPTVSAGFSLCVGYTWEREVYLSFSVSISSEVGSVTLAKHNFFDKEVHVMTLKVKDGNKDPRLGGTSPLVGIVPGELKAVDDNVVKNLNVANPRSLAVLSKTLVQLYKDQLKLREQVKNLTTQIEAAGSSDDEPALL